jgi:putative Holliday junction resolvase
MRLLGIDPGTKRVGIAVADDEESSFAHPRTTLDHVSDAETARAIAELVKTENIGEIVMGLPIGLDGREGLSSRRARTLAAAIERATSLPVVLFDERMTSQAAHRALDAMNVSQRKRRGKVDRIAAVLLLEAYLEMRSMRKDANTLEGEDPWDSSAQVPGLERRGRGDRGGRDPSRG